ncbi:hypothetical protein EV368DRAFT_88402 [Lentinula lateritia]|nr:hypothetical protein EV368DRAFT_88402 [Lentinula lateritia]
MTIDVSTNSLYTGLFKVISEEKHLNPADILDDLEESHDQVEVDLSGLSDAVCEVSKGVSEKTSQEYLRCDENHLNGSPIAPSMERSTYAHAQKMRAAATFGFGQIHGLGMQAWHQSEMSGKMLGNPSVSETVSSYMLSLWRRKTRAGETATSARAVTSQLLECLYHFNRRQSSAFFFSSQKAPKGRLGAHARFLLNLGYNLAFCGLLRVDEMLKIQMQDILVSPNPQTGQTKLTLRLPFPE